jgi:hypothetical protein
MAVEDISKPIPRAATGGTLLLWLIPATLYYSFLLCAGTSGLFAPAEHGAVFNSMLLHLLQGRFDVDPAAVGDEGYLRDGAVYAYFGIFPALFRALFLWLPDFAHTDLTRTSCLAAVGTMALSKLAAIRLVWRHGEALRSKSAVQAPLLTLMAVVILLGGPQIQFLRPSAYQEAVLWGGAFAAVFLYFLLRGLVLNEGFTPRVLCGMALAAGFALLTRVSTALGLYVALGLVWLWVAWQAAKAGEARRQVLILAAPIAILAVFVAVTGYVNFERWGNPLTFADFSRALILEQYPDRLARLRRYGEFNIERIPYGLGYYFAPFWVLRDSAGQFYGSAFEDGFTACCTELPPSSFFVSDPLLLGLGVYGLAALLRDGAARRLEVTAAAIGLAVPGVLMLMAYGMTFRYRMEFYPFFELFAFLGVGRLASKPAGIGASMVAVGAFVSVLTAHALWVIHVLSPLGSAVKVMGPLGIVDFYRALFDAGS